MKISGTIQKLAVDDLKLTSKDSSSVNEIKGQSQF